MSLSIQKISSQHSVKNVLSTLINAGKSNIFQPIPEQTQDKNIERLSSKYHFYNEIRYSIIEIPPPYCSVCNKFMTNNECNNMIQSITCPLK